MSTRLLAGRYELLEKIGDGGMAVVYKARCRLLNRFVAIKILKPEFARNLKFIENFRRESQAAAGLSHPNIVNIYDVGREGNVHYIVMELIEGSILSSMISEDGPLDWRKAVEITKQISSALAFAHKNHIIHRDVKPHNILLTQDGTAKITDFGIAKALDSSNDGEDTTTVMGSVHYFSPEQARGGYVDEKSDIYSLGIVLFEMLTGQVPFDGDNPVQVALMHINDEMPRPTSINPSVPPQIEEVVMKATDKLSINRYSSADEMYDALSRAEFDAMMADSSARREAVASAMASSAAGVTDIVDFSGAEGENTGEDNAEETPETGNEMKQEGKKEKKPFNKMKFLGVLCALVVAIPISLLISHLLGGIGEPSPDEFECPDFRGMTLEAAQEAAATYELEIEEGDTVFSAEYDADTICSQNPDVSAAVKPGKTIKVNISKGIKEGTVPNIVGKSEKDARFALEKYGFKAGSVTSEPNDLPAGIVISQNPTGGEEYTPGGYISFVISAGKAEGEGIVPLLLNMTQDAAEAALAEAGLKLGVVTYENSSIYASGLVMWQSKEARSTAEAGTEIDVKISSGSGDGTTDAGSVSCAITVDYSAAKNDVFWMTVTVVDEAGTHNIITRAQRIKADGSEVVSLEGTGKGTVTVVFDNDEVAKYSVDFNTGAVS